MLELILFPALLGVGFAVDYIASENDKDDEDEPLLVTLDEGTAEFVGTEAKEHVTGNALDNHVEGGEGNDLIGGLEGADTLDGGAGEDRLFGGAGDDVAQGGTGDDKIFLGDGADRLIYADGSDAGDDFIRGGDHGDTLIDTRGSNQIHGDLGADLISTVDGLGPDGSIATPEKAGSADTIHAGFGNDTLIGDSGDLMTGGEGEDSFIVATALQNEDAPAVLADFDLRDDMLSVVFLGKPPADPTISFSFDEESGLIYASVEGQNIATISGLEDWDIPFITTFTTTLPELLATAA
ncbi:Hemolysin-type calcium-binding repeat family protein [Sulfitobacter noctilucae]|uniref:calcium-binding protein n=1 Tax=Sulfitobacter noctilucae TaxID=1342302 RepID=UPI0004697CF9|nr:calcium-binding protein [Sulfitobacter noctilucae]KIN65406.1 Hemolysin-type calcium-binding repeat family protein [Sulfitobacter noctilucae]